MEHDASVEEHPGTVRAQLLAVNDSFFWSFFKNSASSPASRADYAANINIIPATSVHICAFYSRKHRLQCSS